MMIFPGRLAKVPRLQVGYHYEFRERGWPLLYTVARRPGPFPALRSGQLCPAGWPGKKTDPFACPARTRRAIGRPTTERLRRQPGISGRIILTTQAPQGMPGPGRSPHARTAPKIVGFAVSLEQAMRELTARWVNPSRVGEPSRLSCCAVQKNDARLRGTSKRASFRVCRSHAATHSSVKAAFLRVVCFSRDCAASQMMLRVGSVSCAN